MKCIIILCASFSEEEQSLVSVLQRYQHTADWRSFRGEVTDVEVSECNHQGASHVPFTVHLKGVSDYGMHIT